LTRIDLLNPAGVQASTLPAGVKIPVTTQLALVIRTLEKVAMRKLSSI